MLILIIILGVLGKFSEVARKTTYKQKILVFILTGERQKSTYEFLYKVT